MLNTLRQLIANEYEAALCMLNACMDRCPETAWNAPVVNHAFCQTVFHTLFFTDLYLGEDLEALRQQAFHRENEGSFGDYEELEDRIPRLRYDRSFTTIYLEHCRNKASEVIAAETEDSLDSQSGFAWLACSRFEVHIYNIRHIQHHAAQLSMRLRIDFEEDIPWVKSGWREL